MNISHIAIVVRKWTERVIDMKNRLIELLCDTLNCEEKIGCINCEYNREVDCKLKRKADYLLANGVIVPSLTIDDYVYQYHNTLKEIHGYRIEEVIYYGKIFKSCFSYQAICKPNGVVIRFSESDIGKSVFLTREEAEQALKERAKQ